MQVSYFLPMLSASFEALWGTYGVKCGYFPVAEHYRKKLGGRILKVPVSVADTCPNRLGLKGMRTCVFCDEWGSAAQSNDQGKPLQAQVQKKMDFLGPNYKPAGYLIYFQAYTNTFLAVSKQRELFDEALSFPNVKGLVVGTRPDCLSKGVLDLWAEYAQKCFLSVEMGVQSLWDHHLDFLARGHNTLQFYEAMKQISQVPNLDVGVHLIFGLPNETDEEIIQTAQKLSELPIHHVKLHNLHVLKNTELEKNYLEGSFIPIELEEYSRRIALFLEHLNPGIAVSRLAALASRWSELVAPSWTQYKMRSHQFILDYLKDKKIVQGAHFLIP